jgi:hypothetical protein
MKDCGMDHAGPCPEFCPARPRGAGLWSDFCRWAVAWALVLVYVI